MAHYPAEQAGRSANDVEPHSRYPNSQQLNPRALDAVLTLPDPRSASTLCSFEIGMSSSWFTARSICGFFKCFATPEENLSGRSIEILRSKICRTAFRVRIWLLRTQLAKERQLSIVEDGRPKAPLPFLAFAEVFRFSNFIFSRIR